jgi:hypothetical protein
VKKSNVAIANNVRGTQFWKCKCLDTDFVQGVSKNKKPVTQKTLITLQIIGRAVAQAVTRRRYVVKHNLITEV